MNPPAPRDPAGSGPAPWLLALGTAATACVLAWLWAPSGGSCRAPAEAAQSVQATHPAAPIADAHVRMPAVARDAVAPVARNEDHGHFQVHVRDGEGNPLPDVLIANGDTSRSWLTADMVVATTDGTGVAVAEFRALDGATSAVVSRSGLIPALIEDIVGGGTYHVVLHSGVALEARVLDRAGRPVEGIALCLTSGSMALDVTSPQPAVAPAYSRSGPVMTWATTDRHGLAAFAGLQPGPCRLRCPDPLVAFTAETSQRIRNLQVAPGMLGDDALRLVLDQPLVAFWRYLNDHPVECAWEVSGRTLPTVAARLTARAPGSFAVAIGGDHQGVTPLSVEVLLPSGMVWRHEVQFHPLDARAQPSEVLVARTAAAPARDVKIRIAGDVDPGSLVLSCGRVRGPSQSEQFRLLRRIRWVGNTMRLPLGRYEIQSDRGPVEPAAFDLQADEGPLLVEVRGRRATAVVRLHVQGRSGRPVSTGALLFREQRRLGAYNLVAARPTQIALVPGRYRLSATDGSRTESLFQISDDDLGRERDVILEIDDR